jgi:hypothetical protein
MKVLTMRGYRDGGLSRGPLLRRLTVFALSVSTIFCDGAVAGNLHLQIETQFLIKVQMDSHPPPPRTMVLRGPSPETDRIAALFASLGSFDVFVAPLGDTLALTAQKIELENSDLCRSAAQAFSVDSIKVECIHRAPPQPLPGCSLGIDFRAPPGSSGVVQRASIYVVLNNGEPCPYFDSLAAPSSNPLPGQSLRPWGGSRLVAVVPSPTPRSILHAIGTEPSAQGR